MDTLWSEKGHFGILGNSHTLVYYQIISYQRTEGYRSENRYREILLEQWCE